METYTERGELGEQENFRRDCLARFFLANWDRARINRWLSRHKKISEDMKARLNRELNKRKNRKV